MDIEATQRWLENVLSQVSGRIERAQGSEAVQAALRGALRSVAVDLRGGELQVDIQLYATDAPDVLIYTDAETSLVENVRGSLAGRPSFRSTR